MIHLELADQSLIEWELTITVSQNPMPWQNPWLAFDVDGDGSVTAFDALLVINEITRRQSPSPPSEAEDGLRLLTQFYLATTPRSSFELIDDILGLHFLAAQTTKTNRL